MTTFDHDDAGNLTEKVIEPDGDGDVYLKTTTDYGEAGVVEKVTTEDNAGDQRVEEFDYDDDLLHPTAVTNPLGQTTTTKTHSGLGVELETTDVNGVPTTMRYDKFGRLRETHHPDGNSERITHFSFLGAMMTTTKGADGSEAVSLLDLLGREMETRVRAFDGNRSRVFTTYNKLGLPASKSRPAIGSGPSLHKTTYAYDNRGRMIRKVSPDGATVQYAYDKLSMTVTDAKGVPTTTVQSLDGDVAERRQAGGLETTYTYGPFGELTKVRAPDGSTQTMSYDAVGHRTRHSDPSSGIATTDYNAFGNVVTETNGAQEAAEFERDKLGRIEKVTSPDGTESRTWDTAENGVGQLASATQRGRGRHPLHLQRRRPDHRQRRGASTVRTMRSATDTTNSAASRPASPIRRSLASRTVAGRVRLQRRPAT